MPHSPWGVPNLWGGMGTDEVINLGPAINTFYDENSPFIHPDKKTLFFSSEGHMAIGGFDIFKSVYENNSWLERAIMVKKRLSLFKLQL